MPLNTLAAGYRALFASLRDRWAGGPASGRPCTSAELAATFRTRAVPSGVMHTVHALHTTFMVNGASARRLVRTSESFRVARVLVSDGIHAPSRDIDAGELRIGGLNGDRQASITRGASMQMPWYRHREPVFNCRQLLVVSERDCATIAELMGLTELDAALLWPNIVVTGVEQFSLLPPGTRLQFSSGATIYITDPDFPCQQPADLIAQVIGDREIAKRFVKAAFGRRGSMAIVEREGSVAVGDTFSIVENRMQELASLGTTRT